MIAVINTSATPAGLKNIENIYITNTAAATVFDVSNSSGLNALVSQGSSNTLTFAGVPQAINVTVQDTTFDHTITYLNTSGSTDTATVSVRNVNNATDDSLLIAGIETVNLTSNGSANNVLGALTTAALAGAGPTTAVATSFVIGGEVGVTLGQLDGTVTRIDASALKTSTGVGVVAEVSATSASTITGSAGNDTFLLGTSAATDSVSAGAGNDTIRFSANFSIGASGDTVDGGAGTDTLAISTAGNIANTTEPTTYAVSNVEVIELTGQAANATYNATHISKAANTFTLSGTTGAGVNTVTTGANLTTGAPTIVGSAGAFTLNLGASLTTNADGLLAHALTVNDTGTGINDSLTINNNARATGGAQVSVYGTVASGGQNLTFGGYETVTIGTGSVAGTQMRIGTISVTGDVGGTSAETVRFSGANGAEAGIITADIIDASGITAAGTGTADTTAAFFMVTGSTATTITGSGGIDVLFGHTSSGSSINGGGGNDQITSGSGNDTILGGDGNDTLTMGGGNDSVDAGAGNDTIAMGTNLATGDTIDGGTGTDTLTLSADISSPAAAANIRNVEIFSYDTATVTQNMNNLLNSGVTTVRSSAATTVVQNAQDAVTKFVLAIGASAPQVTRLVDTETTNKLTIEVEDDATALTLTTVSVNDEDELTINTGKNATAVTHAFGTVTAADLTKLTISGSNNISLALNGGNGNTLTSSIDASGLTGTLNLSANSSTVASTITGPAGTAATITGGSGADTITAGGAADSITAGAGNDSVTAGAGSDTIVAGTGADVVNGGDGTDTYSASDLNGVLDAGGSVVSTGVVVNLSASALLASAITTATGGNGMISTGLTQINTNTAGYLDTTAIATNFSGVSPTLDTLLSIEDVIGSAGRDYIVGSVSANALRGGAGADTVTGGGGVDFFVLAKDDSAIVVAAVTGAATTAENSDTLRIAAGFDRITDFTDGTDLLDLDTASSSFATGTYSDGSATFGLTTEQFVTIRGGLSGTTFTVSSGGADLLVLYDADSSTAAVDVESVVLVGFATAGTFTVADIR